MLLQRPDAAAVEVWVLRHVLKCEIGPSCGVLGAVAVAAQVPAWTAAASHTAAAAGSGGRAGGSLTWPVLLLGGVPLDPDRALPAVHRPSITVKVREGWDRTGYGHQT